jgi:hypothetical protein
MTVRDSIGQPDTTGTAATKHKNAGASPGPDLLTCAVANIDRLVAVHRASWKAHRIAGGANDPERTQSDPTSANGLLVARTRNFTRGRE